MRIRLSAPGHLTSHNKVTEIHKVVRTMRLVDNNNNKKSLKQSNDGQAGQLKLPLFTRNLIKFHNFNFNE
jgi:hypothetical protein